MKRLCHGVLAAVLVVTAAGLWISVLGIDEEGEPRARRPQRLLEGPRGESATLKGRGADAQFQGDPTQGHEVSVAEASPRPEEHRTEERTYILRDLASGDVVPNLAVDLRWPDDTARRFRSDASGRLSVPALDGARLVIADSGWSATWSANRWNSQSSLWVHRKRPIEGFVRADTEVGSKLDLATVEVAVFLVGPGGQEPGELGPDPWNSRWASEHGLWNHARTSVRADGSYELDAPAARGLVVRASAPGWAPAWVDVPTTPAGAERLRVPDLVLVDATTLSGRIEGADGAPIAGARIRALVTQRRAPHFADMDVNRERLFGFQFTASSDKDESSLSFEMSVRTDERGQFELDVPVAGDVVVVAEAAGHVPKRSVLGVVQSDVEQMVFRLDAYDGEPIRFVRGTSPLANWRCIVTDLMEDPTGMAPQAASSVHLASDGTAPGSLMEKDRDYHIILMSPDKSQYVQFRLPDWSGELKIDIDSYR